MACRYLDHGIIAAVVAVLTMIVSLPASSRDMQYPDWESQWKNPKAGQGDPWDPAKPMGLGQEAPLTPKAQAILEASVKDQATGGQGNDYSSRCIYPGMPRMMSLVAPMEIIIAPEVTYMIFQNALPRRIYTDGRNFPDEDPTLQGYSIGRWIDEDNDGRYDVLEAETHNFKGPRALESSGLPLDEDNQTIVKERLFLDKVSKDVLHDEITIVDDAFTRPWAVTKNYARDRNPTWVEYNCQLDDQHVFIGTDEYLLGGDGLLMPRKPGQSPPDLQYFKKK